MDTDIYIDPRSSIIGNVKIGGNSSIWPGAVLRADLTTITIGCFSSIQDNSVIHGDKGYPVEIANFITVGHGAVIHGSRVEDCCVIGMNSIIQNGSIIGKGSIVAAGANIKPGSIVPPFSLVVGNPGIIKENRYTDYILNLESAFIYFFLSRYYIKNGKMLTDEIDSVYQKAKEAAVKINNRYLNNEITNIDIQNIFGPDADL